jgi:hypothetical protein
MHHHSIIELSCNANIQIREEKNEKEKAAVFAARIEAA